MKLTTDIEIDEFIESLIAKDTSEDSIYIAICDNMGKGILQAVRVYKAFLKRSGRQLTAEQRKEKVLALFAENTDENGVDFTALVPQVADSLGVSEITAKANINAVCKLKNIAGITRKEGLGEVNSWLAAHPSATRKQFSEWMLATGRKASTASAYWSAFLFAHHCHTIWPLSEAAPESVSS